MAELVEDQVFFLPVISEGPFVCIDCDGVIVKIAESPYTWIRVAKLNAKGKIAFFPIQSPVIGLDKELIHVWFEFGRVGLGVFVMTAW